MFGLGPTELIVILVLGLLVLGPERIPGVASSLGKAIRSFRRATRDLRDQIDIDDDVRRPFEDLRAALRDEPAAPTFPPPQIAPPLDPPLAVPAGGEVPLDGPADIAAPIATLAPGVASLVAQPAEPSLDVAPPGSPAAVPPADATPTDVAASAPVEVSK